MGTLAYPMKLGEWGYHCTTLGCNRLTDVWNVSHSPDSSCQGDLVQYTHASRSLHCALTGPKLIYRSMQFRADVHVHFTDNYWETLLSTSLLIIEGLRARVV